MYKCMYLCHDDSTTLYICMYVRTSCMENVHIRAHVLTYMSTYGTDHLCISYILSRCAAAEIQW